MNGIKITLPKKRLQFNVMREKQYIGELMPELPDDSSVFKLISYGGFSSIGFVRFVADQTHIKRLTASSLRIGRKHIVSLDALREQKKLDEARFLVGSIMKNDSELGKSYGYYDALREICDKNGWTYAVKTNHSKIILFDTEQGKFILETSSNLNENPNMEHFSFEKSEELYDCYNAVFDEIFKEAQNEEKGR